MRKLCSLLAIALVAGCPAPDFALHARAPLAGRVVFPAVRSVQATLGEASRQAAIALLDPATGTALESALTDAQGAFTLGEDGWQPPAAGPYVLEARKGLSLGGTANRAGASAVRLRTLVMWDGGWISLSGAHPQDGVTINLATTAVAAAVDLKGAQHVVFDATALMGSVTGDSFAPARACGLTSAQDVQPLEQLLAQALVMDEDPLEGLQLDPDGHYHRGQAAPWIASAGPGLRAPHERITVRGAYLDGLAGHAAFLFAGVPAATWSLSGDRSQISIEVPEGARSGAVALLQAGGATTRLMGLLKIRGSVSTLAVESAPYAFRAPQGCAVMPDGTVVVADAEANRIWRVQPDHSYAPLAGSDMAGLRDAVGSGAQFNHPRGVACDAAGVVYVADTDNGAVRRILPGGQTETWQNAGGWGRMAGGMPGSVFQRPVAVAVGADGTVWVAESGGNVISCLSGQGPRTIVAGSGGSGHQDGPALANDMSGATFTQPCAIALASGGLVYIGETDGTVRRLSAGSVTTLDGAGAFSASPPDRAQAWTSGGGGGGWDPGLPGGGGMSSPLPGALVVARDGRLLAADAAGNALRSLAPTPGVLAGGVAGWLDGALADALFSAPSGLATDADGALYVTECGSKRLRLVVPQ